MARGRTIYSWEAKKYATQLWDSLMKFPVPEAFTTDDPVFMRIDYFRSDIENSTWPSRAKTRFKKWDVANLSKILIDVVMRYLGIDDSQIVGLTQWKRNLKDGEPPYTRLQICLAPEKIWNE